MKKQILNVSILLVSSATIIAIWALPKQGMDEEGLYVRDYKEDILVEEEKKDSTVNDIEHGKKEKNHTTENSDTVTKKQNQTTHKSKEPKKKVEARQVKKTIVKTDTLGDEMEIGDIKYADYGRGIQFRKVKKHKEEQVYTKKHEEDVIEVDSSSF